MDAFRPHYKAFEIEELLDLAFFHPLGKAVATVAAKLGLTPTQVTLISMAQGVAGGWMLMFPGLDLWGVALMVLSSVFDSADGQLARMTGNSTLRGRILDGMVGYFMFTSAFVALALRFGYAHGGGSAWWIWALAVPAGLSVSMQSLLYDFYRTEYINFGIKGEIGEEKGKDELSGFFASSYQDYNNRKEILAKSHLRLLAGFREKFGPRLPESESEAYRRQNIMLVRGWNLFGDNFRFVLLGVFCWLGVPEGFFWFCLVPLNIALMVMIFLQSRSDAVLARRLS